MKLGTALRGAGPVMNYHPRLAKYVGGVTPAVLLCSLMWRDRDIDQPDESEMVFTVRKGLESICKETGLTEKELRGAREMLERLGVLSCNYLRVDRILEFTVSLVKLDEIGEREAPAEKASANVTVAPAERADRDLPKGQINHCSENKNENAPSGRGASGGVPDTKTSSEKKPQAHSEMDLIPSLEKILRESPVRKNYKWKRPTGQALERLRAAEAEPGGPEEIRQAWAIWLSQRNPGPVDSFCFALGNGYRGRLKRQQVLGRGIAEIERSKVGGFDYKQQAADDVRRLLGR